MTRKQEIEILIESKLKDLRSTLSFYCHDDTITKAAMVVIYLDQIKDYMAELNSLNTTKNG